MDILVCFKVVNDLDDVSYSEWQAMDPFSPDVALAKKRWNPYDEAALETALSVAEQYRQAGLPVNLTALSICDCPDQLRTFAKQLFAIGYHSVVLLDCQDDIRFYPFKIAQWIACYLKQNHVAYDLIFTGAQAGVGENAQMPLLLAEFLQIPCFQWVTDVAWANGAYQVDCQIDAGRRRVKLDGKVVLAMGDATHTYLRVPTLREKLLASKLLPTVFATAMLNPDGQIPPPAQLLHLSPALSQRDCRFLPFETADLAAQYLHQLLASKD